MWGSRCCFSLGKKLCRIQYEFYQDQISGCLSYLDRWIASISPNERPYVLIGILRQADMMMFLQRFIDLFRVPRKLVSNTTQPRFAALHLSQLLHEKFSVRTFVLSLWRPMFKLSLNNSLSSIYI